MTRVAGEAKFSQAQIVALGPGPPQLSPGQVASEIAAAAQDAGL
jgi:hypothetical protein